MSYPIRAAVAAEFPEVAQLDGVAFGYTMTAEDMADAQESIGIDRFLIATDPADRRIVGVTADYRFDVTLPGATPVAVPGVTWVSVAVTHRRRGILRGLMDHQLARFRAEGLPFAVLTASEDGIYQRFGYGAATVVRDVTVTRARTRMAVPVDGTTVRVATVAQARLALPEIHRRWCARTPGAVSRDDVWWKHFFADRESRRAGMSERFYLLHPDGYVGYRVRTGGPGSDASGPTVSIRDDAIVSAEARAALWQVLLSFDLYGAIETSRLPPDDPLPFLLADPRRVETTSVNDGMWVRLLDVEAALSARTYGIEVDTVLEVRDPLVGDGRYRLRGGPDGATCTRTDDTADLRCGIDALGSAYLGGHRINQLVAAGRIEIDDPALRQRLDLALLADRAPSHGTGF